MEQKVLEFAKENDVTVHSLMNVLKLSKIESENIIDSLLKDENYTKFYLLMCSKCSSKVKDGLFISELEGKDLSCPSCKNKMKFKTKDVLITAIYGSLKDMVKDLNE